MTDRMKKGTLLQRLGFEQEKGKRKTGGNSRERCRAEDQILFWLGLPVVLASLGDFA
jgi:hypothetical protein